MRRGTWTITGSRRQRQIPHTRGRSRGMNVAALCSVRLPLVRERTKLGVMESRDSNCHATYEIPNLYAGHKHAISD